VDEEAVTTLAGKCWWLNWMYPYDIDNSWKAEGIEGCVHGPLSIIVGIGPSARSPGFLPCLGTFLGDVHGCKRTGMDWSEDKVIDALTIAQAKKKKKSDM
jgi:hypothetical protein